MKARALLFALSALTIPSVARAHFVLTQPPNWLKQSTAGDPQKPGPCGGTGTKTNIVTTLHAGDTVHFDYTEAIVHGGHYRFALGLKGQADLPADPTVMARNGISISVPIQNPPVFPVLADGVNAHKASDITSGHKWTYDLKLPAGMTCDACVLQITQFMTDHGSNTGGNDGFFYHHCADVKILAAGVSADAGVAADAGTPDSGRGTGGGGSPTGGASGGGGSGTGGEVSTGGAMGTGGAVSTGGAKGGSGGATDPTGTEDTGGAGGSPSEPRKSAGGCSFGGGSAGGWLLLLALAGRRYFRYRARR
jgi:hypothetical protein